MRTTRSLALLLAALAPGLAAGQTYSKVDTIEYHDDTSLWVLGQIKRKATSGVEVLRTEYGWRAMPTRVYDFERSIQTVTYNSADGTVLTATDANGNVTSFSQWKRGVPQVITYPPTQEAPAGASVYAAVDDSGHVTRATDENGFQTNYFYDSMWRLARIKFPTADTSRWDDSSFTFELVQAAEYGIPAGHWRQTIATGSRRRVAYYDALWRPLLVREYDAAAQAATERSNAYQYDDKGRVTFASYPGRSVVTVAELTKGVRTSYDDLGRVRSTVQDSELGPLTTTKEYLPGGLVRTTDPRLQTTTSSFLAYDTPDYSLPLATVQLPAGVYTDFVRDVFGKPLAVTRRDASSAVALTRRYTYDANQLLCKTINPELGATVFEYDPAGNVVQLTQGLDLPNSAACNRTEAQSTGRAVTKTYDARSRLKTLSFPDMDGNQVWAYTPDGLPAQVVTLNDAGTTAVTNAYVYNKRRMLTGESISQPGWPTWSLGYGYDAVGNLSAHAYKSGTMVDYAPNALGQPTKAGSFASGVSYYPNGGMAQFYYGNGILHTLAQNDRGLPDRSEDKYGSLTVIDDGYDYDVNGNVAAISDGVAGNRGNREMQYDAMDRLVGATSPMYGSTAYAYDVLDNLKSVRAPGRDHTYYYEPSTNRLTNVVSTVGGATVIGLQYDVQGNLSNKNGVLYGFDYGNRLRSVVGRETYRYDAHGRRVLAMSPSNGGIASLYDQAGNLRHQVDARAGKQYSYVTLNGSLVARTVDVLPPNAPLLSVPTINTSGAYTADWTPVAAATRYELEETFNQGAWSSVYSGSSLNWGATGKAAGRYSYRVRACDASCGAWSLVDSVTVERAPATSPVASGPVIGTNGSFTVSWTSVQAATGYVLEESVNGGSWLERYDGGDLANNFSGAAAATNQYRVKACNFVGCGPYSPAITVRVVYVPPTPTLSAPASVTTGSYTVSWTAAAGATTYQLEESTNGGAWATIQSASSSSRPVTGKTAGTYSYRVASCNDAGCSVPSNVVSVIEIDPPSEVPVLTAPGLITAGNYSVTWTSVAGASTYQLEESANGGAWTVLQNTAAQNMGFSGKTGGTYRYRAAACNVAGCGTTSVVVTVQEVDPPSAPTLSAPGVNENGSYTISWSAAAGADRYELQEYSPGGNWTLIYNGSATSWWVSRSTSQPFYYLVRACNVAGCGPTSGTAIVQQAIYGAQFVAQSVPSGVNITPGEAWQVSVQMRNTGNTTWTAAAAYNLGSQTSTDNTRWGLNRVPVPGVVAPGQVATFTFTIYGPQAPEGLKVFQWRMVRDGVTWFGDQTPLTYIPLEDTSGGGGDPDPCQGRPNCHEN